jgi:predicted alpha/beta-hydrolase family hydrolase
MASLQREKHYGASAGSACRGTINTLEKDQHSMQETPLTLDVEQVGQVSALHVAPPAAKACYVLAHGAGAGMNHAFMRATATELAPLGIATLRFQFPYMERGSKRTDPPPVCHATVRAAVAKAAELMPNVPLVAGGRSFGGRMTSQAQAEAPLNGVRGLVFLGFPLHPAGRPETTRAAHLAAVEIPMLFVQGTRDELAKLSLLEPLVRQLAPRATLHLLQDADHSFHVPAKTGRKDPEVRAEALRTMARWIDGIV